MVNRRSSIARMSNVFNVVGVCICTINSSAKSCLSGVKVMTEAKAAGIFTLLLLASPQRALVTASSFLSSSNGDDDGDDFGGVLDWVRAAHCMRCGSWFRLMLFAVYPRVQISCT